jgi:hypothetical protein
MSDTVTGNRNIIAASILAGGLLFAPVAAQAAIAGTTTVTGSGSATCPSGYKVVGGGFKVPKDVYAAPTFEEYKVTSSAPSSSVKWTVTVVKHSGVKQSDGDWRTTTTAYTPQVWATCVK